MPRLDIASLDDPRLAPYRQLKANNLTRWAGQFVVEGEKLVRRLLESSCRVLSVLVDERSLDRLPPTLAPEIDLLVVPNGAVPQLAGFNFHRGMLACAARPDPPDLEQMAGDIARPCTLAVCPQLDDPENLGGVVRVAAALGARGVIVGPSAPDPFSRRVLRVSMGSVLQLPVLRADDLHQTLDRLQRLGCELIATVLDPAAEELSSLHAGGRNALLLGREGEGLGAEWIDRCQRRVTIGMQPGVDSLNVAVAAGIVLYHLSRRR